MTTRIDQLNFAGEEIMYELDEIIRPISADFRRLSTTIDQFERRLALSEAEQDEHNLNVDKYNALADELNLIGGQLKVKFYLNHDDLQDRLRSLDLDGNFDNFYPGRRPQFKIDNDCENLSAASEGQDDDATAEQSELEESLSGQSEESGDNTEEDESNDRGEEEEEEENRRENEADQSMMDDDGPEEAADQVVEQPIEFNGVNLRAWLRSQYAQANEGVWVYKSDIQSAMFQHFRIPRTYQTEHRSCVELGVAIRRLFPRVSETRPGNSRHGYRSPAYMHLIRRPVPA